MTGSDIFAAFGLGNDYIVQEQDFEALSSLLTFAASQIPRNCGKKITIPSSGFTAQTWLLRALTGNESAEEIHFFEFEEFLERINSTYGENDDQEIDNDHEHDNEHIHTDHGNGEADTEHDNETDDHEIEMGNDQTELEEHDHEHEAEAEEEVKLSSEDVSFYFLSCDSFPAIGIGLMVKSFGLQKINL